MQAPFNSRELRSVWVSADMQDFQNFHTSRMKFVICKAKEHHCVLKERMAKILFSHTISKEWANMTVSNQ